MVIISAVIQVKMKSTDFFGWKYNIILQNLIIAFGILKFIWERWKLQEKII